MIALDTGFLLAAEGYRGHEKWRSAYDVLKRIPATAMILPAQALAELLQVLKSEARLGDDAAALVVARWLAAGQSADIGPDTIAEAQSLELPLQDALILASSVHAGAQVLISDDVAEGADTGIEIIDPFTPQGVARLDQILGRAAASA